MISYFSKLILTKAGMERRARTTTTGEYQIHKEMWELFPGNPDSSRGFLYCVMGDGRTVFMVSEKPPYENEYWAVETKEYDPQPSLGQFFGFRICANPTKANSKTGKHQRHDVVMDLKRSLRDSGKTVDMNQVIHDSVSQWICRKGLLNGFEPDPESLKIHSYNRSEFEKKGKNVVVSTVVIEGALRVTDPLAFRNALMEGVGTAKGFGCGLLMIRRL